MLAKIELLDFTSTETTRKWFCSTFKINANVLKNLNKCIQWLSKIVI